MLRQRHPAWRMLRSDHAPLIAGFLHRVFITPNVRVMAEADMEEALEDELFGLREQMGADAFPKSALEYLNDWAANEKGWLRKFYPKGSDEPHFDLTPAAEKAISWIGTLMERAFVGTESRLLTLFTLLRQMSEGSESDPQTRLAELRKRRYEIDAEMARVRAGDITTLSGTALKDRFQQFMTLARELLSDFREVENNFRRLDRRVRERIALWDGGKGALLEEIMGERDAIADSDQGSSFRAFWEFLMSGSRQEELTHLLERVLALPPVAELRPDIRIRRVHYDWLEAGEHTLRTVAQLSQQLRRFLDDQTWLENRRIMDILHGIETKALAVRDVQIPGEFMQIDDISVGIELLMERPLYTPPIKPLFADIVMESGDEEVDAVALFSQVVIDKAALTRHIRNALQERAEITLGELIEKQPLQHVLAELIAYLQLAGDAFKAIVDDEATEAIVWKSTDQGGRGHIKQARLPRVIFVR
ncbi:MAG: DUF3375 domain-containing protein [Nitrospiraceae bacterium]|nr:DUF3375 domain-containing protein [Nitrospiraceae bacterium]